MKYFPLCISLLFMAYGCGKKTNSQLVDKPASNASESPCMDTIAQITFVNTKTVEIQVNLSNKTSVKEGNTVVNSWKNFKISKIPVGDSLVVSLKFGTQYMLSIYGPNSAKPNGIGLLSEEKFMLNACEKRRQSI
jgi:hypothetical protein